MARTVKDILEKKGTEVATASPGIGVVEAARRMNELKIGALVVIDGEKIAGVFTERDILNKVIGAGKDASTVTVGEVMTSPVTCISADAPLSACSVVMTQKRIRHLPVIEGKKLTGIITSGDVMASEVRDREQTIEMLYEYIQSW